jgi:hypothetical protein
MLDYDLGEKNVHVGPSDYVPWLTDRKWAYIRMEGSAFGDVPLNLELKLEVWDSPNSAGVVIDAVRCAKLGLDHGLKGALFAPSSYFKKSPPLQIPDDQAREMTEAFIRDPRGVEAKLAGRLEGRAAGRTSMNGHVNGVTAGPKKKTAARGGANGKAGPKGRAKKPRRRATAR